MASWIADVAGISIISLVRGVNMLAKGRREHLDLKSAGHWTSESDWSKLHQVVPEMHMEREM